jgi:hypothetical protein
MTGNKIYLKWQLIYITGSIHNKITNTIPECAFNNFHAMFGTLNKKAWNMSIIGTH